MTTPNTKQNESLARTDAPIDRLAVLPGSYRDPKAANARLAFAAQSDRVHLISPSTMIGALPEGCSISIAKMDLDIEGETYPIAGGGGGNDDDGGSRRGGKRGLSKVALDRIARAAGVSWCATQSRRLDDRSDARYAEYLAVGRLRGLDGAELVIQASKVMDLRDGSPTTIALEDRARKKKKSAENEIRQLRAFIAEHAETKAKNRAIRSLGIRTSYSAEELKKPFAVVRLMWTGASDDPVIRRENAAAIRESFLRSSARLYGPSTPAIALPAPSAPPPQSAARGHVAIDDDELDDAPADAASQTAPPSPAAPVDGGAEAPAAEPSK